MHNMFLLTIDEELTPNFLWSDDAVDFLRFFGLRTLARGLSVMVRSPLPSPMLQLSLGPRLALFKLSNIGLFR